MAREIKFRAWDKFFGSFVDGDLVNDHVIGPFIDSDEFEVTQYTGLKDDNGVEIYEGDLLQSVGDSDSQIKKVVFYDNGFCLEYKTKRKFEFGEWEDTNHSSIHFERCVIVGNVYENKL